MGTAGLCAGLDGWIVLGGYLVVCIPFFCCKITLPFMN